MRVFEAFELRHRWIFISLFCLILMLVLVSFYSNQIAKQLVTQNREESLQSSMNLLANSLDSEFGKFSNLLTQVNLDPEIRSNVKEFPIPPSQSARRDLISKELNIRLGTYASSVRYLEGIFIINEKSLYESGEDSLSFRNIGSEVGTNVQIDQKNLRIFESATNYRGAIQWVPISMNGLLRRQSDDPKTLKGYIGPTFSMVRFYDNLVDRNGQPMYIVFDINMKWFRDWFKQQKISAETQFAIVDRDNRIVYSPGENAFGMLLPKPNKELLTLRSLNERSNWTIVVSGDLNTYSSKVNQSQWLMGIVLALLSIMIWFTSVMIRRFTLVQKQLSENAKKLETTSMQLTDRNQLLEETTDQLSMRNAQLEMTSEEMKQKNEQLSRLIKVKDQVLANTSHELRTPLNGIIGLTEALLEGIDVKPTPIQKQNLALIYDCGKRLQFQIDQILDFAKLRSGQIESSPEAVDVNYCIQVAIENTLTDASKKGLALQTFIEQDVPTVWADPKRLVQMLVHLLNNAIKFTIEGYVRIRAYRDGMKVCLEISDSGIGISNEQIKYLFSAFEQGDGSAERLFGGTGLGLAIVKKTAELYGATVDVESKIGEGTKIFLRLKIADRSMAPQWTEGGDSNALKVLIVDDEPINVHVLTNHLTRFQWDLHTANSGKQALQEVDDFGPFDLMLVDVMMPFMNGYELVEKIREKYDAEQTAIIVLSAKPLKEDEDKAYAVGANGYLLKPFSKETLMQTVRPYAMR